MSCYAAGVELPDVSVVIVTYNTADLIGECLSSVERDEGPAREIFVVDNASTDGGAELLCNSHPEINLIANKENRGFAAANNQALPLCRGRYIFYLNPDTKLAASDVFQKCVRFMDVNPHIGLAGVKLVNPDGSLQESVSYRYPGEKLTRGEVARLKGEIACVMGAGMIARADLVRKLGGFDESFTLYGEDQDLCLRIRKAGYEIGFIEGAVVLHYGGQSERLSLPAEVWRKKTFAEYHFYRKHYSSHSVARIRRADLLKARYRLLTLGIMKMFAKINTEADEKMVKYRAICNALEELKQDEVIDGKS
ncbi:MAG: glycosyltransferase family 2 protein [Syntrophobacterales bacterium]|nr:glycosyltransferase family 2 protein [Syntrophobacterales bacterium]